MQAVIAYLSELARRHDVDPPGLDRLVQDDLRDQDLAMVLQQFV